MKDSPNKVELQMILGIIFEIHKRQKVKILKILIVNSERKKGRKGERRKE